MGLDSAMNPSIWNAPTDEISSKYFSFANADEHFHIAAAIQGKFGIPQVFYILDPIPVSDHTEWLWRHQVMHDNMNLVLGIAGNDLTQVDFKDEQQREAWAWLHAQEHAKATDMLGI